MRVLSLFSGVGGIDLGLEAAGHTVVGQVEIDPHARSVLARHWPTAELYADVTTLDGSLFRDRVDLVAGGSPCQDLSVAGRRNGLGGERSRLFWDQCRIATESHAGWVLWENVAGALSSNNGEDFAAVLWGLTGCRPAVPADGWRTIGVCVGPDRTAVWRLLDARWFGVAQRRRRVFVVSGPRDLCGPEILVDPESCPRGARPVAPSGQEVAGCPEGGAGNRGWAPDTDRMTFLPWSFGWSNAAAQGGEVELDLCSPLRAEGHRVGSGKAVAFSENQRGEVVAVPLAMRGRADGAELEMGEPDVYNALRAGDGGSSRQNAVLTPELAVRRLTPRECERLMGWPDDHTRWAVDGTEIADSHRYRFAGNGVVSPVAQWIGERLGAAA